MAKNKTTLPTGTKQNYVDKKGVTWAYAGMGADGKFHKTNDLNKFTNSMTESAQNAYANQYTSKKTGKEYQYSAKAANGLTYFSNDANKVASKVAANGGLLKKTPAAATPSKTSSSKTSSPVSLTKNGSTLYSVGAKGAAVDEVGQYLVDNGYLASYDPSKGYTEEMQTALAAIKPYLLNGEKTYTGKTFGDATLNAIRKQVEADQQQQLDSQAILDRYQAIQEDYGQAAADAYYQAMLANKNAINANYDDSARDYYTLYRTQEAELPEALSRAGVTGGASESAQLDLMNAYANNLRLNESNRNGKLYDNEADYQEKIASNSANLAKQMAEAYYNSAQNELAYQREQQETKRKEGQQRVAAYQQQLYEQEQQAIKDKEKAEADAQKAQINAANDATQSKIAKLKQQGYKVYSYKDSSGLIQYEYAAGKTTKSGSSGSSKKKSGSSGSKKGSGTGKKKVGNDGNLDATGNKSSTKSTNNYQEVKDYVNQLTFSNPSGQGETWAKDYINKAYKDGSISAKQKNELLKSVKNTKLF